MFNVYKNKMASNYTPMKNSSHKNRLVNQVTAVSRDI